MLLPEILNYIVILDRTIHNALTHFIFKNNFVRYHIIYNIILAFAYIDKTVLVCQYVWYHIDFRIHTNQTNNRKYILIK